MEINLKLTDEEILYLDDELWQRLEGAYKGTVLEDPVLLIVKDVEDFDMSVEELETIRSIIMKISLCKG